MNDSQWFMLIYETDDAGSQEYLSDQLHSVGAVTVHLDQSDSEYFVVIECQTDIAPLALHELVMSFDYSAVLIGSHAGPVSRHLEASA